MSVYARFGTPDTGLSLSPPLLSHSCPAKARASESHWKRARTVRDRRCVDVLSHSVFRAPWHSILCVRDSCKHLRKHGNRFAKKTRAVPSYLTVEQSRCYLSARACKAFHLAPPFGQKEARNEHSELGICTRYGLNADHDQRANTETILQFFLLLNLTNTRSEWCTLLKWKYFISLIIFCTGQSRMYSK